MKTYYILIVLLLSLCYYSFAQQTEKEHSIHQSIQKNTASIFEELVAFRRDLHIHPELSGEEKRTSKKIEEYLTTIGIEVKKNIGGYGVIGILNGAEKGRKIAWRADIDALSTKYPDVVDFKSINKGVRHICGHDVHSTIALGIAKVLSTHKDQIKGTIYFIFQPSEENYQGAKAMIADKLFDIIKPEEIYATHISPFPKGYIASKPNNLFSHTNKLRVIFDSSDDNTAKVNYVKKLISSFQNVEPNSPFWSFENLGSPTLGIENPNTIYKNYFIVNPDFEIQEINKELSIEVSVNSSNKTQLSTFLTSIKTKIEASAYAEDFVSAKYTYKKATVTNNKDLTIKTLSSIASIYGPSKTITLHGVLPGDIGDDFAYFQNKIPGVYYFLGGSNFEKGIIADTHSPNFAVDEESIKVGVNYFSSMIVQRLNSKD